MCAHSDMHVQYAFLDSGIGGLSYFSYFKKYAPNTQAVYIADTEHFPYGEKTREEVIRYAKQITAKILERFNPEVIAIVCNTISVTALNELRNSFPIPFVGTVPAIKKAAYESTNKRIAVIATDRTITAPYITDLIETYAPDCFIEKRGDSALVAQIEQGLPFEAYAVQKQAIAPALAQFTEARTDAVVLACTHFLHLADVFAQEAPAGMKIIDSREGVITQLLKTVPPRAAEHPVDNYCYGTGAISAEKNRLYERCCTRFGLTWGGRLV